MKGIILLIWSIITKKLDHDTLVYAFKNATKITWADKLILKWLGYSIMWDHGASNKELKTRTHSVDAIKCLFEGDLSLYRYRAARNRTLEELKNFKRGE